MKAWQYTADNVPIILSDIPEPRPAPGEVLVDVRAAGLCHTDVGFLDGSISSQLSRSPITLGHEISGVITAVNGEVGGFQVGDRVAVVAAVAGPGTSSDGGFQPRVAVQSELLVAVPASVDWEQAAVSTDAGATSHHALISKGRARSGERVGIVGLGGLGSLAVQIAVGLDARVYVAETNTELFDYARRLGVEAVSTTIADFKDVGLDLICDFAGYGSTTADAVSTVSEHGRVVQVGLGIRHATLDMFELTLKQVELLGSVGGSIADNVEVLRLMAQGTIEARTKAIPFEDIGEGLRLLAEGRVTGRLVAVYD